MRTHRFGTAAFAILLVFLLAVCAMADGAKAIAVVTVVQGKTEVNRGQGWTKLNFGEVLDDGHMVRTGADGFVSMVFTDDKTQIKIRPNTEITVTATRNDDYSLSKRVNMEVGELFANVAQQKGAMEVATPTAVASVKGTQFWVIVEPDGTTLQITLEGLVSLLNIQTGQESEIGPGFMGTVDPDGNMETGGADQGSVPEVNDEGSTDYIEIELQDENGQRKTLIIQYQQTD